VSEIKIDDSAEPVEKIENVEPESKNLFRMGGRFALEFWYEGSPTQSIGDWLKKALGSG